MMGGLMFRCCLYMVLWAAAEVDVLARRPAVGVIQPDGGFIPPRGQRQRSVSGQRLWQPTPAEPVPVDRVFNFTQSGPGGLNNLFWAVTHALVQGCNAVAESQAAAGEPSAAGSTRQESFGVVILPPLKSGYENNETKVSSMTMHFYSDLFELEPLSRAYAEQFNCFVSDSPTFDRLVARGAVRLSREVRHHDSSEELGRYTYQPPELMSAPLYQNLRLSHSLRRLYFDPCMEKIQEAFGGDDDPYLVAHMRVEDDWIERFCKTWTPQMYTEHPKTFRKWRGPGGMKINFPDNCFGADEIARMIYDVPELATHRKVLMLYAPANFLRPGHERHPRLKANPVDVWPEGVTAVSADSLHCFEQPGVTYTMRSALAFFMAAASRTFVGFGKSSMSMGVGKFRHIQKQPGGTFSYGCYTGLRCYNYVADVANANGRCNGETQTAARVRSRPNFSEHRCSSKQPDRLPGYDRLKFLRDRHPHSDGGSS